MPDLDRFVDEYVGCPARSATTWTAFSRTSRSRCALPDANAQGSTLWPQADPGPRSWTARSAGRSRGVRRTVVALEPMHSACLLVPNQPARSGGRVSSP